jgi:hypothetical protein
MLFGTRPCLLEEAGRTGKKIAIATFANHVQGLDVGRGGTRR